MSALASFDIETPATIAVIGREHVAPAGGCHGISRHSQAQPGRQGVRCQVALLGARARRAFGSREFEDLVDGIMLVQRYIKAPQPSITRVEFVGNRLLYAVRVDTSQGFELCPADACQVADPGATCPAVAPGDKFQIISTFPAPPIASLAGFPCTEMTLVSPESSSSRMPVVGPSHTISTRTRTTTLTPKPRTVVEACRRSHCI